MYLFVGLAVTSKPSSQPIWLKVQSHSMAYT